MVEQFSSFVQEALEFLSLLRASEKERFETEKKFMAETTKILKELAMSIQNNNTLIKNSLENLQKAVDTKIEKIVEKIGMDQLNHAISALEASVDLIQRGSTLMDYKYTLQKTRDLLDEVKGNTSRIRASPASVGSSPPPQVVAPVIKPKSIPNPVTKATVPGASTKQKSPLPKSVPQKSMPTEEAEYTPSFKQHGSSIAQMMGTRTKTPRRAIQLKTPQTKKIVNSKGEDIEIETGPPEDD